eukprot:m.72684 g.72684  ORF g.72684 m.72684 type:complete len:139 (-) comp14276_c0_seq3:854-1270(-)
MHRAATLAEVQALLKASSASSYDAKRLKAVDKTRRSDSELETVVSIQAGMSKYLERRIQHALDYFVEQLQNDDLRTDVAATANFDWRHLEQVHTTSQDGFLFRFNLTMLSNDQCCLTISTVQQSTLSDDQRCCRRIST